MDCCFCWLLCGIGLDLDRTLILNNLDKIITKIFAWKDRIVKFLLKIIILNRDNKQKKYFGYLVFINEKFKRGFIN